MENQRKAEKIKEKLESLRASKTCLRSSQETPTKPPKVSNFTLETQGVFRHIRVISRRAPPPPVLTDYVTWALTEADTTAVSETGGLAEPRSVRLNVPLEDRAEAVV